MRLYCFFFVLYRFFVIGVGILLDSYYHFGYDIPASLLGTEHGLHSYICILDFDLFFPSSCYYGFLSV